MKRRIKGQFHFSDQLLHFAIPARGVYTFGFGEEHDFHFSHDSSNECLFELHFLEDMIRIFHVDGENMRVLYSESLDWAIQSTINQIDHESARISFRVFEASRSRSLGNLSSAHAVEPAIPSIPVNEAVTAEKEPEKIVAATTLQEDITDVIEVPQDVLAQDEVSEIADPISLVPVQEEVEETIKPVLQASTSEEVTEVVEPAAQVSVQDDVTDIIEQPQLATQEEITEIIKPIAPIPVQAEIEEVIEPTSEVPVQEEVAQAPVQETLESVESEFRPEFYFGDEVEDYVFDEEYVPSNVHPFERKSVSFAEYIDLDTDIQVEKSSDEPSSEVKEKDEFDINIFSDSEDRAVEVVFTTLGNVVDVQHLQHQDDYTYFGSTIASGNDLCVKFPMSCAFSEIALFKTNEDALEPIENELVDSYDIAEDGSVTLNMGVNQIFLRLTQAPPKISTESLFKLEREKVFPFLFACAMSLLLFISSKIIYDEKELNPLDPPVYARPVLYKPAPKMVAINDDQRIVPKEAPAKEVAKVVEKPVKKVEKEKVVEKKVAKAIKKNVVKVVQKTKAKPTTNKLVKQPIKKVAQVKTMKKSPVKTYSFKSNKSFKSLFGKTSASSAPMVASGVQANSDLSGSVMKGGTLNRNVAAKYSKVGKLGSQNQRALSSLGKNSVSKSNFAYAGAMKKINALGDIDPKVVEALLRERLPQFRHCYQRELMSNKVSGVFDINFTINGKGKSTSSVQVNSKTKPFSQTGVGCIRRVLSIINFPKPKSGIPVDIKLPLNFVYQGKVL